MSAETLRRAASGLRDEWGDDDGPRPMGTAWHRERDFHLAVADWLDAVAAGREYGSAEESSALTVARTYLGES